MYIRSLKPAIWECYLEESRGVPSSKTAHSTKSHSCLPNTSIYFVYTPPGGRCVPANYTTLLWSAILLWMSAWFARKRTSRCRARFFESSSRPGPRFLAKWLDMIAGTMAAVVPRRGQPNLKSHHYRAIRGELEKFRWVRSWSIWKCRTVDRSRNAPGQVGSRCMKSRSCFSKESSSLSNRSGTLHPRICGSRIGSKHSE